METDQILSNVAKHIDLNQQEIAFFTSLLKERQYEKKQIVLHTDQSCHYLNFVNEGILRAFHLNEDGKESTVLFALRDWWITDMSSFINNHPSMVTIESVEKTTVLQISKNDLNSLYLTVPKFERYFRILMQNAYIREQLRVIENLSLPAVERYKNFIKKHPKVINQVAQKQIASYLGISPEFLSTIRKSIK